MGTNSLPFVHAGPGFIPEVLFLYMYYALLSYGQVVQFVLICSHVKLM